MADTLTASPPAAPGARLRSNCLNYWEVLAQAIALISPTMTAALIVPAMYGNAGNGSWLAYAFGTVMLLFVALNLNQFAKRSTTAGSMFAYVDARAGPDGRRHDRLVSDLGLSVHRHRRTDRLHQLRQCPAGQMLPGPSADAAPAAVCSLRGPLLVSRVSRHPVVHDPDAGLGGASRSRYPDRCP